LIESNYCNYLEKLNRLDEAAAQCRSAIEHDPTLVEAYNNLGTVQIKQAKFEDARLNFDKALELDPGYSLAYGNLAKLETYGQNVDKAAEYLGEAIANDKAGFFDSKRRAEAYSAVAIAAMRQKRYDLAAACFKLAFDATPDNTDIQRNLALAYRMSGRADEAIRLLEDVIRKNPNSAEAFNTLGTIYAEQDRKPDAIVQFQRALKINPNFVQAQNNLKKAME
jgi:tetratricopeptide (TPR) repeat protein